MKTFCIIFFILVLFSVASCNNSNTKDESSTNENIMLAKEITSSCVANIDNTDTPEWTKGFNRQEFFKEVFEIVSSEKVKIYGDAELGDTINMKVLSAKYVKERMAFNVDTFDLDLLKEIRFLENWAFNENNVKFEKHVRAWVPIKVWKETDEIKKSQVFYAYPGNPKKGKIIAKDIFYEHPWYQEYPNLYTGFDQLNFLKVIIDKIKSGETVAYDPIYLVDKSKRKFSPEELETYIGQDLEPIGMDNSMNSILFEEDWYFDENTLGITKDVKSIAFVGFGPYDATTNGPQPKKILFFLFPK